jgi:chromosomal replication initiation ATPase DnaA
MQKFAKNPANISIFSAREKYEKRVFKVSQVALRFRPFQRSLKGTESRMQQEQLNLFGLFSTPSERQKPTRRRVMGHHPSLSLGPAEQSFYIIPERLKWRELVSELQNARRSLLFAVEGGSGHGKTAFLHWLCELLRTQHFSAHYTSAMDMVLPTGRMNDLTQVILIDDVQDLIFYPHKQSAFCHAFDESKSSWPPVHWVVTSSLNIKELLQDNRLSERMKQRLEGLHPLHLPTLGKNDQLQLANFWRESLSNRQSSVHELSDDVQNFLQAQKSFNGHKLLALIERLTFSSLEKELKKAPISSDSQTIGPQKVEEGPIRKAFVKETLVKEDVPQDPIKKVFFKIEQCLGIKEEEIMSSSRQQNIVIARFLFIYFLYQTGSYSKLALAKILKKDHTSILYALEKMQRVQQQQGPQTWWQAYEKVLCWSPPA